MLDALETHMNIYMIWKALWRGLLAHGGAQDARRADLGMAPHLGASDGLKIGPLRVLKCSNGMLGGIST